MLQTCTIERVELSSRPVLVVVSSVRAEEIAAILAERFGQV
tara:strand:- start:133 stop:255 length:123 start_codon:yes stop_codon:yes gene_type:complete